MNNVKLVGLAMLMAGLAAGAGWAGSDAPADPGDQACKPERKGPGHGLARELGLSEEKSAEVKSLMHEGRKTMLKLKADRDLAKADLDKLLAVDPLDEKAVSAAADKLAQVNADMTKAMVRTRLAVSAALTPEQRARLPELRQGMMERVKERGAGRRDQGREGRARDGGHQGQEDKPKAEGDGL